MNYKREVYEVLKDIGVPTNLRGYHYMLEMTEGFLTNRYSRDDNFTKIYKSVGEVFNCTYTSVERDIRHTIENVLEYADKEVLKKYFGGLINNRHKVTNTEFVLGIVEYIKMYRE